MFLYIYKKGKSPLTQGLNYRSACDSSKSMNFLHGFRPTLRPNYLSLLFGGAKALA